MSSAGDVNGDGISDLIVGAFSSAGLDSQAAPLASWAYEVGRLRTVSLAPAYAKARAVVRQREGERMRDSYTKREEI